MFDKLFDMFDRLGNARIRRTLASLPILLSAALLLVWSGSRGSEPLKDGLLLGAGLVLIGIWSGSVIAELFGATMKSAEAVSPSHVLSELKELSEVSEEPQD